MEEDEWLAWGAEEEEEEEDGELRVETGEGNAGKLRGIHLIVKTMTSYAQHKLPPEPVCSLSLSHSLTLSFSHSLTLSLSLFLYFFISPDCGKGQCV
jgi:hypothetical protein